MQYFSSQLEVLHKLYIPHKTRKTAPSPEIKDMKHKETK